MDLSNLTEENQRIVGAINKTLQNAVAKGAQGYKQFNVAYVGEAEVNGEMRTIISLFGTSDYKKNLMIKALVSKPLTDFTTEELQDIANQKFTYSFPSEWLERDNAPYLPSQGEPVKCLIVEKANKQGVTSTFIEKILPVGNAKSAGVSLADVLAGKVSATEEMIDESEAEAIAKNVI